MARCTSTMLNVALSIAEGIDEAQWRASNIASTVEKRIACLDSRQIVDASLRAGMRR